MSVDAVMIRARASTRDILRELAEAEGVSLIDALERVVAQAKEQQLLAELTTTLDGHVHAVIDETVLLDAAVAGDGLDPDDDFSDW
jgi:hypothetical protein